MMGIGVGIDYVLLMVTRYREFLAPPASTRSAATVATADTAGRAVLVAGTTVVISMLGLFAIGLNYMRGAALATIARRPGHHAGRGHAAARAARLRRARGSTGCACPAPRHRPTAARRPGPAGARVVQRPARGTAAAPASRSCSASRCRSSTSASASPTPATPPRDHRPGRPTTCSADGFGPGANGPLLLVADARHGRPGGAAALADDLAATPGVAAVTRRSPNPAGDAALITVVPDHRAAGRRRPRTWSAPLRDDVVPRRRRHRREVHVGGLTAMSIDTHGTSPAGCRC